MYNRYIPNGASYTRVVEEDAPPTQTVPPDAPPPEPDAEAPESAKPASGLGKLLRGLKLDGLDTGDVLLLLILLFLFLEGDDMELVITLGLLLLLGSCSTAAEKGGYQLYFASGLEDGSAILSEPYQGEADPGPRELMEALLSGPTEEELNSPFPSGVSLRSWGLEEGVLVLNLSEQYGGLTDISLTVADYCIVLTMSQLDGVEAVEINVAGQPVSYRNHQILTREEAVLSQPGQGQEAPNEGA